MNVVVHVQNGVKKHGYEFGTRQAWKCGVRAHEVSRVIGVVKGKIVTILDGVSAELSNIKNNPKHNLDREGRYIFTGGVCWTELDILSDEAPNLLLKNITNLNQGHCYLTDEELERRLLIS